MAFDSFRDFVNQLDKAGELKRIAQPVATELEITEIADREMKSPGGGKALLFEKPTVNGVVSPFPVAINTMGSHKRMAMSMGAESVDDVANELGALMKAKPPTSFKEAIKLLGLALDLRHAKPKTVKTGSCKEVIQKFDAPASRKEPWPSAPDILGSAPAPGAVSDALVGNTSDTGRVVGEPPTTNTQAARGANNYTRGACAPHSPQSSHSQMLAARWRTFHHTAMCRYQRPGHGRAQCRHVSHPDLRRPHDGHALAVAESRRTSRTPLLRNRHADARFHFHRRRPDVSLRRDRAAARRSRRISPRWLSPQKIRRTGEVRDERFGSSREFRFRHRRLRGPDRAVAR